MLSTSTPFDVQNELKNFLKNGRLSKKLSRRKLSELSGVPNGTIQIFEDTARISLRQFLLLYAVIYDLDDITNLIEKRLPRTMDEVLKNA